MICVSSYPTVDYTFVADIFSNLNHWNMEANKVKDSHRPPTDSGMAKEEFIRVGTTLYKIVVATNHRLRQTVSDEFHDKYYL